LGVRSDKDKSRSFLARGSRILRRQGSKINIVATLDEEDEADRERPRERELFGRRVRHAENSKCPVAMKSRGITPQLTVDNRR
jgi:hypothetical protein